MNGEITEPTVRLCWNESAIRRAAEVLRAAHLDIMAADVEAHLKPTIEEPSEFGSIVRAKFGGKHAELWTNTPWHGEHYWRTEAGWSAVWPELTDVEVIRIGVGDAGIPEAKVRSLVGELYRLTEGAITAPARECYDRAHDLTAALLDEDGR